jgi:hypothetical protein
LVDAGGDLIHNGDDMIEKEVSERTLRTRYLNSLSPEQRAIAVMRPKAAVYETPQTWSAPLKPKRKLHASQIAVGSYSGAFAGAERPGKKAH